MVVITVTAIICHFYIANNTLCLPSKSLHQHCLSISLGTYSCPRRNLKQYLCKVCGRRSRLVVNVRAGLWIEKSGFEPWPGHCVVFLGKTLYSQCLSPPRSKWVKAKCQGNLTKCWVVTCDGPSTHPGGVAILIVASCYRNRDKLQH